MADRDHIHPLAYRVLHETRNRKVGAFKVWDEHDRPELTRRASRVLAAVEHQVKACDEECRAFDCALGLSYTCPFKDIRQAWKKPGQ